MEVSVAVLVDVIMVRKKSLLVYRALALKK